MNREQALAEEIKTLHERLTALERRKVELEKAEEERLRYQSGLEKLDTWVRALIRAGGDYQLFHMLICQGIQDMVGADLAALALIDAGRETFTYQAAAGAKAAMIVLKTMPLEGGGLCGWVAAHGEALCVPDLSQDPRVIPQLAHALDVTTGVLVPLRTQEGIIGGLSAFRKGKPFDQIDEQILTLFSQRITPALENMRLLRTLENRVSERTADLQREILERKRTEEILQESEKRYRMLFESAGDAIFILEAEGEHAGNIVAANKTAADIHGYSVDELMHKNIRDLDTPETAQNAHDLMRRILSGEWIKNEIDHRRKNGTVFPVEVSAGLLELGNHKYILAFDRDITERKSAEQKLERYAAELKQSNEDVLSFAYIVSHDLRAPLVSIKGFIGELRFALKDIETVLTQCMPHLGGKERTQLATAIQKDVPVAMNFISSSVSRMDGLINAVLTLSRLGHRELKLELIEMKELTKSILSSLAHQIEQRKTVVTIGDLPMITTDKLAMEQIMGNLLDNALKYLDPVREGTIAVSAEQNGEEVVFHISDNGCGIAPEDFHKVFEIFRRAGKQDVPGEGMGLAYVKTLVRRQGGRIWCESEPGKGATFSFTIPGTPASIS